MLIQRWFRRYKSRIEMRKLTAWNIYKTIEYSGEQTQLKLYDFFLTLIRNQSLLNGGRSLSIPNQTTLLGGSERRESVETGSQRRDSSTLPPGANTTTRTPLVRKQSLFSVNTDFDDTFLLEPDTSLLNTDLEPSNIGVINRIFENELEPKALRKN